MITMVRWYHTSIAMKSMDGNGIGVDGKLMSRCLRLGEGRGRGGRGGGGVERCEGKCY